MSSFAKKRAFRLDSQVSGLSFFPTSISIEKVCRVLYAAVLVSLVLDIGGAFGLKYGISALLLLWVLVLLVMAGIRRDLSVEFVVLLFFGFSACYSIYRGIEIPAIASQLSFIVYFALLLVVLHIPRDATSDIFRRVMIFGSLIVFGTFLVILLFPITLVAWKTLSDTYRLGYLGLQNIGGQVLPNVYYRWSMWLIPAFIVSIGRFPIATVVIGSAVLITLSTSVIAFTVLGTLLLAILLQHRQSFSPKNLGILVLASLSILAVVELNFSIAGLLYENVISKFSASTYSTSVKLGHIEGVLDSMHASISYALFGMGVGSEFFSPGVDRYVTNIEVSHFNFVRQFGLIGGAVFFGYVLYVIVSAFATDALGKRWAIGLLMLFLAAGTNPLLMSPVFMVVLVTVRSYVARFEDERANE